MTSLLMIFLSLYFDVGFPGGTDSKVCLQGKRPGFDPWVRKIPWRRKWLPSLVFLLENSMDKGPFFSFNSVTQSCPTLCNPMNAAHLSITNSQSLLKLMSIESVIPSNQLILCRPLLLLPSIFPSIRVFSNESTLRLRWPKYWSFSFSISSSNEYSELMSFRMDWLDLLAVQRILRSLLQHHSSKASIL